jgi:hypothetical protein
MISATRAIRGFALTAGAAWLVLSLPGSARADNWWNSMLGFVGMGPNKPADDAIDYSARPALVVPPTMDLPPPQTAVAKPVDWPNDPDAIARRKAEAGSRRPAPPSPPTDASDSDDDQADQTDQAGQQAAQKPKDKTPEWVGAQSAGLSGGGSSIFGTGGQPLSLPNVSNWSLSNWNPFAQSDDTKAARTLKVGVEPQREYLTQPPPGYRAPVAVDSDDSGQQVLTPPPAAPSAPLTDKSIGAQ